MVILTARRVSGAIANVVSGRVNSDPWLPAGQHCGGILFCQTVCVPRVGSRHCGAGTGVIVVALLASGWQAIVFRCKNISAK